MSLLNRCKLISSRKLSSARFFTTSLEARKQYLVIAKDFIDEEAISRRLATRDSHLSRCRTLYKDKLMLAAGALKSDDSDYGKMLGSYHIYEADSIQKVKELISQDPYLVGRVWEDVKIMPLNMVPLND
ncbi:hypothetical protein K493DRAFT_265124 [Basidiobolus meristosporus CBS 931.73]|uniref:YCII-related domain-containing protein n=1 Tax=Basidiobolus meristosporus CBS 931.73 TaxID=1314790 RepID=A0A1Y1XZ20_9FUNG|nr:hypothetical protein K493DRAFT_265124 [Basidiobolus meristosporus CBS 931.73]|eukprot:ORX90962.1 hypothetical protein K493DRAFT_265124 [Basidiobolus meristosporus CBS 931.73]